MQMLSVDVFMFEDNVGLVAVTHTLHILPGDFLELPVGQLVFRRRVQRYMEYRVVSPFVGLEVRHETLHTGLDIHTTVLVERLQHLLPIEDLGFILIHLLLVVV